MNKEVNDLYTRIRKERNITDYYGSSPEMLNYAARIQNQMGLQFTGWSSSSSPYVPVPPTITYPNVLLPGGGLALTLTDLTSVAGYKGGTHNSTVLSQDVELCFTQTGTAGFISYVGFSFGIPYTSIINANSYALVFEITNGSISQNLKGYSNGSNVLTTPLTSVATATFCLRRTGATSFGYKIGVGSWNAITLPAGLLAYLAVNATAYTGVWYYNGAATAGNIAVTMQPTP